MIWHHESLSSPLGAMVKFIIYGYCTYVCIVPYIRKGNSVARTESMAKAAAFVFIILSESPD